MQISSQSALLAYLANAGQGKPSDAAETARNTAVNAAVAKATVPETAEPEASVKVSLSDKAPPPAQLPPVYAEIWRDGHKIGEVYVTGEAALPGVPGGLTLHNLGSGLALAQQRAEEIARLTGAEVRYTDADELQAQRTRDQLRIAYRSV